MDLEVRRRLEDEADELQRALRKEEEERDLDQQEWSRQRREEEDKWQRVFDRKEQVRPAAFSDKAGADFRHAGSCTRSSRGHSAQEPRRHSRVRPPEAAGRSQRSRKRIPSTRRDAHKRPLLARTRARSHQAGSGALRGRLGPREEGGGEEGRTAAREGYVARYARTSACDGRDGS